MLCSKPQGNETRRENIISFKSSDEHIPETRRQGRNHILLFSASQPASQPATHTGVGGRVVTVKSSQWLGLAVG